MSKTGEFFGALFGIGMIIVFTVTGLDACAPTAIDPMEDLR